MSHDRGCWKCGAERWDYKFCQDKDCAKKGLFCAHIWSTRDNKKEECNMCGVVRTIPKAEKRLSYWLFLDDERYPPSLWRLKPTIICRNNDEFEEAILSYGVPDFISFDHDLGSDKTGHDCAIFLLNWLMNNKSNDFINFAVHSANPVGAANIKGLLNNWNNKGRVS